MGWVLDGIFSHGAPLAVEKMLIVREWGERNYFLIEMGLGSNPYVYERLYEKWGQKFQYDQFHLYEWRNPGDHDYNSEFKPKDLILWKPWIPELRPAGSSSSYHGHLVRVAFDKTAQNKVAVDVLAGLGYAHAGYGGDSGL